MSAAHVSALAAAARRTRSASARTHAAARTAHTPLAAAYAHVSTSLPVMQAAQEQMQASCAMANCVAMRQLSVGLLRTASSSCSMKRVTATEEGKQHTVSAARHSSGAARSPHWPLQGKAPWRVASA